MKYKTQVEEVLAGASISATAKKYGIGPESIRRDLLKHPNYAEAKAKGMLKAPGLPGTQPKLIEAAATHPAVAEVVASTDTIGNIARKHRVPPASLAKMVHIAHPDFSIRHRGKSETAVLEEKLRKLNLNKAKQLQTT